MKYLSAFVIGAIFGLGIVISGMGNPAKVQNFFDLFGTWDPSLTFVMGGGLLVFLPGYFLIVRRRTAPILEPEFRLPQRKAIDAQLVGGAALFGVGWGVVGFCPGGAIPMVGTLDGRSALAITTSIIQMQAPMPHNAARRFAASCCTSSGSCARRQGDSSRDVRSMSITRLSGQPIALASQAFRSWTIERRDECGIGRAEHIDPGRLEDARVGLPGGPAGVVRRPGPGVRRPDRVRGVGRHVRRGRGVVE